MKMCTISALKYFEGTGGGGAKISGIVGSPHVYSSPEYPQVNYLQVLISLVNDWWLCPVSDRI